ncbi:MAG TPA: hypothetical protein GXX29_12215 [Firmicutes bacterium]|nr:hypothetical protein [Bacillota bacterium]
MQEQKIVYFDAGERPSQTTPVTLELAKARMEALGIKQAVVASGGTTALAAAKLWRPLGVKIIGVTLQAGTWAKYGEPDWDKIAEAKELGVQFITATHPLMGNVGTAVKNKFGGICHAELIAYTLYLFSQGMKVAVEVALAAADAGLLDMKQEVVAVAGTDRGANTAIVAKPAFTTNCFDFEVKEILCMPR